MSLTLSSQVGQSGEAAAGHGIPEKTFIVTSSDVSLPKRAAVSHKGDYGRLLIIGGSTRYTGAPTLAARAALRAGAGLVTVGVPEDIFQITAIKNDEAMPFSLSSREGKLSVRALKGLTDLAQKSDVIALGMGLGRGSELTELVREFVRSCKIPLVIDADGLNAISGDLGCLGEPAAQIILTPHEGEFIRLGGDLSRGRVYAARSFAGENGCALVLKGHRTLCAFPDGEVYIISAGNPGMAKGGSGDALSGVIGSMLCQLPFRDAVVTACWLHARAGDICADNLGEYSVIASDIIEALSAAAREIINTI